MTWWAFLLCSTWVLFWQPACGELSDSFPLQSYVLAHVDELPTRPVAPKTLLAIGRTAS